LCYSRFELEISETYCVGFQHLNLKSLNSIFCFNIWAWNHGTYRLFNIWAWYQKTTLCCSTVELAIIDTHSVVYFNIWTRKSWKS
jgi:hypothetical protein